ncbi:MAG: hypothetical protein QM802_18825 [Agriterribacter sp.]
MTFALKILNSALILFALYMGIKQGWAMLTGKQQMIEMFGKWNFSKEGIAVLGGFTILGAVLVLFPQTFLWGNFITAAGILLIICLHLNEANADTSTKLKGAFIELTFLLLSLVIIYLQHPLKR